MQANFLESNPIPVKAALAMMGRIREVYRLPLTRMKEETRAKLEKVMTGAGLEIKAAEPAPPRRPRPAMAAAAAVSEPGAAVAEPAQPFESGVAAGDNGNAVEEPASVTETIVDAATAIPPMAASQSTGQSGGAAAVQEETAAGAVAVAEESPAAVSAPAPVQAAPEPVTFFLYESWQAGPHKLALHRSTCGACRGGTAHPSGGDEARSRWHGPYTSVQEARETSRGMSNILIRSECKCVSKS
jgi:hypothetical protein